MAAARDCCQDDDLVNFPGWVCPADGPLLHIPQAGTVIVIGGALQPGSESVWQRIVDEAGGPGARVAVFPTAAYEPERISAQIRTSLEACGAQVDVVPLAPHLTGTDLQAVLHDPAVLARVAAAQAVFFSGGAQEYLVDTLQPGGQPTALLQAIRRVFDAGGVVAGTSAGAAVMSRLMFRDAMDNLAVLKGLWRAGHEYDHGFGFVSPELLIDQHFLKRGRIGRLLPALQALGLPLGLGVDENAAVVIRGSALEVIGGSGAVVVDLRAARTDAALPAFNLQNARLTLLQPGDRHDLQTARAAPRAAAAPASMSATPGLPAPDPWVLDMLEDGALQRALYRLMQADSAEVRGLAFRAEPNVEEWAPDLGFEFRLYRDASTRLWRDAEAPAVVTVAEAGLDVVPVRVARPWFVPLSALPPADVAAVLGR